MKAVNAITLTTVNSRYGTIANERVTSNAMTTYPDDGRYEGLRIAPRLARMACNGGVIEAGKAVQITAPGSLSGALNWSSVWLRSGWAIRLCAVVDFDDDDGTSFQLGERVSEREWRRMSLTERALYNWMFEHARGIRRAVRRANLVAIEWGRVAYGIRAELATVKLTDDVDIDGSEGISASVRIFAY